MPPASTRSRPSATRVGRRVWRSAATRSVPGLEDVVRARRDGGNVLAGMAPSYRRWESRKALGAAALVERLRLSDAQRDLRRALQRWKLPARREEAGGLPGDAPCCRGAHGEPLARLPGRAAPVGVGAG